MPIGPSHGSRGGRSSFSGGSSGGSRVPHLHLEIIENGMLVDPEKYLE